MSKQADPLEGVSTLDLDPLSLPCVEVACSWAGIPHCHEGTAIYPAPPDDPQWLFVLGADADGVEERVQ